MPNYSSSWTRGREGISFPLAHVCEISAYDLSKTERALCRLDTKFIPNSFDFQTAGRTTTCTTFNAINHEPPSCNDACAHATTENSFLAEQGIQSDIVDHVDDFVKDLNPNPQVVSTLLQEKQAIQQAYTTVHENG